jgi:hypothetical protein
MIGNDCRCPGCGNCGAEIAVERLTKEREDLVKSLREARKSLREAKQKYAELSRMNESYVKQLHAAERERDEACQKEREGCARICDLEFAVNWHSSAMAAANAAKRCAELIRASDEEPHACEPKDSAKHENR